MYRGGIILWLYAALVLATPVQAQDNPEAPAAPAAGPRITGDDVVPLEVTIRPSYRELKDGQVEDAIIRLNDRHYMLYSGLYIDDPGARLRPPGDPPPLTGLADALGSVIVGRGGNYGGEYRRMRRFGLNRNDIALELGTRFSGLNYVEIALAYGVDPFPRPTGFAAGKGIYGRRKFNSYYSIADQTLGTINLIAEDGPGAEFYYQIAPGIAQLMAALSEKDTE